MPSKNKSNLRRAYQLGTMAVKKVPEYALVGALVLIGTELVKREVSRQTTFLPPVLQDLANKTLIELDSKLDMLMQLEFDVNPFIASEFNILRTQPAELVEKFVNKEIISKVELLLPNILTIFITDQTIVKSISKKVLDLVRLVALVVIKRDAGRDSVARAYNASATGVKDWWKYGRKGSVTQVRRAVQRGIQVDMITDTNIDTQTTRHNKNVNTTVDILYTDDVKQAADDLWELVAKQGLTSKLVDSIRQGGVALEKLWPTLQLSDLSVASTGSSWNPALDRINKLLNIYKEDSPDTPS